MESARVLCLQGPPHPLSFCVFPALDQCATPDCPYVAGVGRHCSRCARLALEFDSLEALHAADPSDAVTPIRTMPSQPDPEPGAPAAPGPAEPDADEGTELPVAARSRELDPTQFPRPKPSKFAALPRVVLPADAYPLSLLVLHILRTGVGCVRSAFCLMPLPRVENKIAGRR